MELKRIWLLLLILIGFALMVSCNDSSINSDSSLIYKGELLDVQDRSYLSENARMADVTFLERSMAGTNPIVYKNIAVSFKQPLHYNRIYRLVKHNNNIYTLEYID